MDAHSASDSETPIQLAGWHSNCAKPAKVSVEFSLVFTRFAKAIPKPCTHTYPPRSFPLRRRNICSLHTHAHSHKHSMNTRLSSNSRIYSMHCSQWFLWSISCNRTRLLKQTCVLLLSLSTSNICQVLVVWHRSRHQVG